MEQRQKWGSLCVRLAAVFLAAGALLSLPDTQTGDILRVKHALIVLLGLFLCGKLLLDTLFYDR